MSDEEALLRQMNEAFARIRAYVLDENYRPVRCRDIMAWGCCMRDPRRIIGATGNDQIYVSTVFLGFDHGRGSDVEKPIVFETMVFRGDEGEIYARYSTWEEAEEGHRRWQKYSY
jgi:hypothetical protein